MASQPLRKRNFRGGVASRTGVAASPIEVWYLTAGGDVVDGVEGCYKAGRGYMRYTRVIRANRDVPLCALRPLAQGPLDVDGNGWRQRASDILVAAKATCFFHCLPWIMTEDNFDAFFRIEQRRTDAFIRRVTIVEADALFDHLVLQGCENYGVVFVGPLGDVQWVRRNRPVRACVLVQLDDAGRFAPHWLPATSVNDRVILDYSPLEVEEWLTNPSALELLSRNPNNVQRMRDLRPVEQQPMLLHNDPPVAILGPEVLAVDPGMFPPGSWPYGFVTSRTPPFLQADGVVMQELVDNFPKFSSLPRVWLSSDFSGNAVGLRLMAGSAPDAVDRALAHGGVGNRHEPGVGLCWEFSPSVFLGADIHPDDYVFVEQGPPHKRTWGLNVHGQYMPDRVSVISTDCGTWCLKHVWTRTMGERLFHVYTLHRVTARNLFGICWTMMPFTTETVDRVILTERPIFEPGPELFPRDDAWYRVQYALLASVVPVELVGPLSIVRNEEFALAQRSGVAPSVAAEALLDMRQSILRDFGDASGLTFSHE